MRSLEVVGASGGGGGGGSVVNTDGDPGDTIYIGSIDPEVAFSDDLEVGDIWIEAV